MTTRREFVQASVAAAAVATPTVSALTPARAATPAIPLYRIVFDQRFAASAVFGAEARRLGADVRDIKGDITEIWYHDLYHRWREAPVAVAGMTGFSSLLGLQMMAGTVGMRVIYRAHHRPRDNGTMTHEIFGPVALRRRASELRGSDANWSRAAAGLVMGLPAHAATVLKAQSNIADADRKAVASDALISWVIAPVRRA